MDKLFGTDGIRGKAGSFPLDKETVKAIGWSLAKKIAEDFGRTPSFITGRDTRESGEWIERAFHNGAQAGGAFCESASVITTPGVAFLTGKFGFDAGIVISASHNSFEDNGIKVFSPSGKKMSEETESAIENFIRSQIRPDVSENTEIDTKRQEDFRSSYLAYLREHFPKMDLSGMKIVADCANGAASDLAPELFRSFGADVTVINASPNGRNINENCGSLHLEHLQTKVVKEGADFGVAFDGDADRSLFVDEKGGIVDGDATLWIMAQFMQDHGRLANRTVVATVMSNIGLELALESRGLKLLRASVGDKYVLEDLLKTGSDIGGEQSGHIIFPETSLVGDGMMTALHLLEANAERQISFSKTTDGFIRYPQILVNVRVKEKRPFESVHDISVAAKIVEKELHGHGRLLLRYSGTENLARVMIEGKDQATIAEQAGRIAKVITDTLG
ncbi:MAG: phosphoglucosamine mutase [Blastocatellia bacterium]